MQQWQNTWTPHPIRLCFLRPGLYTKDYKRFTWPGANLHNELPTLPVVFRKWSPFGFSRSDYSNCSWEKSCATGASFLNASSARRPHLKFGKRCRDVHEEPHGRPPAAHMMRVKVETTQISCLLFDSRSDTSLCPPRFLFLCFTDIGRRDSVHFSF